MLSYRKSLCRRWRKVVSWSPPRRHSKGVVTCSCPNAGTRVEPLRTSAWDAKLVADAVGPGSLLTQRFQISQPRLSGIQYKTLYHIHLTISNQIRTHLSLMRSKCPRVLVINSKRIIWFYHSMQGNWDSGIREIGACVIRNPELWIPEYSSRNPESH